ncbi:MAG: hypothetical protein M5R38_00940 [Candidatus Methylomirabilis sp.]|nr:hypothetical protein [Candidatus Methylomirabilis sp.]
MGKRITQVSAVIGLAVVLALACPALALAEIRQVQMGVDGMV